MFEKLLSTRAIRTFIVLFLSLISLIIPGCNDNSKNPYSSPPQYDLNRPERFKLRPELDEISGIVYYQKDRTLFAIHDERGWIYKIFLTAPVKSMKWKFGEGADIEDLALVDSTFYALRSNGNLLEFKFLNPDSTLGKNYEVPKAPKKEFEILYYDSSRKQLIMICKDCEHDQKNQTSAYAFDIASKSFVDSPIFTISAEEIEEKLSDKMPKFKPSAASIHPITGDIYIVSSINKLLVVVDQGGKVKGAYPIDPKLYKQPEGLTFNPRGDMFISNESADIGAADILYFKYKASKKR